MSIKITNGLVVDGTNSEPFVGDVVIEGSTIISVASKNKVTKNDNRAYDQIIDAEGLIVAPGFIDIHTHSDVSNDAFTTADSKILQGVTSEIVGNCGISTFPTKDINVASYTTQFNRMTEIKYPGNTFPWNDLDSYFEHLSNRGSYTNIGALVGHGTLRANVIGFDDRDPNKTELEEMSRILDELLKQGAFGMSLGLIYPPGIFSKRHELVELSKVLKRRNRILSVHMRNEANKVFESVEEMLNIAEESGVRLQISHLKLVGKSQWGRSSELLKLIEDARERGIDVQCDQYPYEATATSLAALAPKWAKDGGNDSLVERLKNSSKKLIDDILQEVENRGGTNAVLITNTFGEFPNYEGKRLLEIAESEGVSPFEIVRDVLIKTRGSARAIYFSICEDDIVNIMKSDYVSVGSDGYSLTTDKNILGYNPHPRNFGTFPRFLEMVRDKQLMSIQKAVYKMTGLNKEILGINDRGILQKGFKADITIFDKDLIKDNSTYLSATNKPSGIKYVIVNGKVAVSDNVLKLEKLGEALKP
ncbi:MAG: D-aminoacylase [Tissierellaceae bacterium]|nr:D-aminoacylase [Tissierellaceae bacterium]